MNFYCMKAKSKYWIPQYPTKYLKNDLNLSSVVSRVHFGGALVTLITLPFSYLPIANIFRVGVLGGNWGGQMGYHFEAWNLAVQMRPHNPDKIKIHIGIFDENQIATMDYYCTIASAKYHIPQYPTNYPTNDLYLTAIVSRVRPCQYFNDQSPQSDPTSFVCHGKHISRRGTWGYLRGTNGVPSWSLESSGSYETP